MFLGLGESFDILYDNIKLNFTQFNTTYTTHVDGRDVPVLGFRHNSGILYGIFNEKFYEVRGNQPNSYFCDENKKQIRDIEIPVERVITSNLLKDSKISIVELEMHPAPPSIIKDKLEEIIFSKKLFIELLQKKKLILIFFYGWEADYFGTLEPDDNNNTVYNILLELYEKYKIPRESIIFQNSNASGQYLDSQRPDSDSLPISFYENWFEFETFHRVKGNIPEVNTYTFEEHFELLKKESNYNFLRLNRTSKPERDVMLYWTHKLGLENDILFEHPKITREFLDIPHLNHLTDLYRFHTTSQISKLKNGKFLYEYIGGDEDTIQKLEQLVPLHSNQINTSVKYDVIENEPIPHSVYTKAPLSYVFTSFPERDDYVFFNQTVFNPIYNYHPLLFFSNYNSLFYFQKQGYYSYDWIFDETYDKIKDNNIRLLYSYREMMRINDLGKNKILDLIYNNQDKLIFNREKLIRTESLMNYVTKLATHLKMYYL